MKKLLIQLFVAGLSSLAVSLDRAYHLIQQQMTWSDAKAYCQKNYVNLAVLNSEEDVRNLQAEADLYQLDSDVWIGLYNDVSSWRWSNNNISLGFWRSWAQDEPDNNLGHQECVLMTSKGLWMDVNCDIPNYFVCYNDKSKSFIFIKKLRTWTEAQTYCREHYTELACALTQSNNQNIRDAILGTDLAWIGLSRDSWKWVDQSRSSSLNWASGQPDNANQQENCALMRNGLIADYRCSEINYFFCFSYVSRKEQITRVGVRASQDVNNPEVKAAILEKIQQKLNQQGMSYHTSLRWREQKDGSVFYKK